MIYRRVLIALVLLGGVSPLYAREFQEETVSLEENEEPASPGPAKPGPSNFLVTGFASAGYTDSDLADSNFTAALNPVLLWKVNDRILVEGELEFELEDEQTETNLEYAQILYTLNDYATLGAGKFLSPFGIFRERIHPDWINKFPDNPLGYNGGASQIAPTAQIGAQIRGAIPVGPDAKALYAVYVSNGPSVSTDAASAGELHFADANDNNDNKALGGRVGIAFSREIFSAAPSYFEVGYSWEVSQAGIDALVTDRLDVLLQGVDFSWRIEPEALRGVLEFKSEIVWSDVDRFNYGTGTGAFENKRYAEYLQVSYRPTKGARWIRNFEPVFRFDAIYQPPRAPSSIDEKRYTVGLNYWLGEKSVLKFAYLFDKRDRPGTADDAFLAEIASGF